MQRIALFFITLAAAPGAFADTPQQLLSRYGAEAARAQPGFAASVERGAQFFSKRWNVSAKMQSCASCHTDNPAATGSHAVTGKTIQPLAPAANPERFSSEEKVEKWFRRNCSEVLGRECSAAEKADFIQFLASRR